MSTPLRLLGQTERLLLRAPQEEDLEEIADLWTDPRVTEHIGEPRDRDMIVEGFREYAADPLAFAQGEGERLRSIGGRQAKRDSAGSLFEPGYESPGDDVAAKARREAHDAPTPTAR